MRLLNTTTLQLEFFIGTSTPPYAILSHTWEKEEILFDDIQSSTATIAGKKGFAKVKGCCDKAVADGFDWVWIDSCCIDKSSSAELSEAINSMYLWYQKSTICYAYLQDVTAFAAMSARNSAEDSGQAAYTRLANSKATPDVYHDKIPRLQGNNSASSPSKANSKFGIGDLSKSRWFTRGWTLQELVAPKTVEFYTSEWVEIGTRGSLPKQLSKITGIPTKVLCGEDPSSFSIAERMSWASGRQTTREEDVAYCLLGLFGVSMPLLYGEGPKSFYRLQEQILRQEEDYSIFAWSLQHDCRQSLTGLLASSPNEFSKTMPAKVQPPTMEFLNKPTFELKDTAMVDGAHMKVPSRHAFQELPFQPQLQLTNGQRLFLGRDEYDVLWEKPYDRLTMFTFKQRSWFLHVASITEMGGPSSTLHMPTEPPTLLSRGLRLSLPIMTSDDPRSPSVAWLYCELGGRLLCILIRHSASSRLHGRCASPWLLTVDASLKKRFTVQTLYMHPNGMISEKGSRQESIGQALGVIGRVKVNLIESKNFGRPHIIMAYPPKNWNLNGFSFRDEPRIIGTVLIEFTQNSVATQVAVAVGVMKGQPWCEVRLWNFHQSSLSTFFDELAFEVEGTATTLNKSDRRVIICDERYFLSAAMRQSPSRGEGQHGLYPPCPITPDI